MVLVDLESFAATALAAGAVVMVVMFIRLNRDIHLKRLLFGKRWFSEMSADWPGQAFSLEFDKVLFDGKSKFQDVKVLESTTYGRVLILDGVIQATERDEFSYQEMQAHIPLFAHPNPKRVLVIGGGDGGVLREVARHNCVEEIDLCELDDVVMKVSREYMYGMARGFDDPRVKVHIADGYQYMLKHQNSYDVVIVDSSDPVGPAEALFSEDFYKAIHAALTPDGIALTQAECIWLKGDEDLIKGIVKFARNIFKSVDYALVSIPTYTTGTIGLLAMGKGQYRGNEPHRPAERGMKRQMRYYTPDLHKASFVLPQFARRSLGFEEKSASKASQENRS